MMRRTFFLIGFLVLSAGLLLHASHPGLFLTPKGVKEIRSSLGKIPAFDQSYQEMKKLADEALLSDIVVPQPKDAGGGYTHEKHKKNYYEMNAAGIVFQISKDKRYAEFVKKMLYRYAEMYPALDLHPVIRSKTRGKIFWQALNEAVWLVHTSMAYDCVYDYLSRKDRQFIEKNLFYPMAEFLSNGNQPNYDVFNMMHNHGTWATAAVGMIGYAMGDKNLTQMALYGSNKDGRTGFIRQLDFLFSPDGYFTEGPYYQRYAIWPFMTFAQVIQNQQPELKIFEYRDGILMKAVDILLQSSYQGEIFYLNDALTKTFKTQEIVYAVNIAYSNNPGNKSLLDIARWQGDFVISDAGIATAKALSKEKNIPVYGYRSLLMRDGLDGSQGGIAIIRSGSDEKAACLTFKATSHGLSHGHYDKLSITLHDNGHPVLTDYGAVRFLNIEPKYGGHYTKENYSWAMQTIAHNTVTVDSASHFNADIKVSSEHHSEILYSDYSNPNMQIVSGREKNATPGVEMHRTVSMIKSPLFDYPLVVDVFRLKSEQQGRTYDLPFYYQGHMVSANFEYSKQTDMLLPLGKANGYQHLWLEAKAKPSGENAVFCWFKDNRFYSITTLTNEKSELLMTRTGAGDPLFFLRQDAAFMIRQKESGNHTFVSVVEPHGLYDINKEVTVGHSSRIKFVKLLNDDELLTVVAIHTVSGKQLLYAQVNSSFGTETERSFQYDGKKYEFKGNYYITEISK
jgi:oligo-alginate lyase